jgi:hypothetical protein
MERVIDHDARIINSSTGKVLAALRVDDSVRGGGKLMGQLVAKVDQFGKVQPVRALVCVPRRLRLTPPGGETGI